MAEAISSPYSGIKVLDMSQGLAGPYCGEILLQYGASVIKVEPFQGDWSRGKVSDDGGMTAMFLAGNFGKRSICVDTTLVEGIGLLRSIASKVDILIESFRPDVMGRLGLSYEDIKPLNPEIVYVSINGFGADGPYARRPATDSVIQAMSGLMSANADDIGMPRRTGLVPLIDAITGVYAAQVAGAALFGCAGGGGGRHVEISLLQSAASIQAIQVLRSKVDEVPVGVPKGVFKTLDGYMNVYNVHDRMFAGLCRAIGRKHWIQDIRYATSAARSENAAALTYEVAEVFRSDTTVNWVDRLSAEDVICGPINDYHSLLSDPQVIHKQLFDNVEQAPYGHVPAARAPGVSPSVRLRPAPFVGEHTRQVLREFGFREEKIDALFQAKVVM